jgi:demethylmenaquinone methyltransferase/2-methoxy-6-polyprenyl-1,4-benzoquinol methylase
MRTDKDTQNAAEFRAKRDDIFGRIATRYDLLSDLFSLGIHRLWKQRVAQTITTGPWDNLLDSATGTGDVVLRALRIKKPQGHQTVMASDISPQMLDMARKRLGHLASLLEFRLMDAESMPEVPNASVDVYSISLGLKICKRNRVS